MTGKVKKMANVYIQRTKDLILDYLGKAQETERKISEGRKIYQPDSMEQEEKRLRGELAKTRRTVEERLDAVYHEASASARDWGKLDGSRLTDDVKLLEGQGVTPEQFTDLVNRYSENFTMLDQLRKYGDARNKAAEREYREHGGREAFPAMPYDTTSIPSADSKMQEWDAMRKRADYFLNCADGSGFTSDFEKTFAIAAAQKQFDAWGEDQQQPDQRDSQAITDAIIEGWGFGKR